MGYQIAAAFLDLNTCAIALHPPRSAAFSSNRDTPHRLRCNLLTLYTPHHALRIPYLPPSHPTPGGQIGVRFMNPVPVMQPITPPLPPWLLPPLSHPPL